MEKVKILHFWPCQESKWAISCQNEKTPLQIFYMLHSIWQTTKKLTESWKYIGGKSTLFCLGPKTGNRRSTVGLNDRFPCVVQSIWCFSHFKGADVQEMRKVLFLIVLNKGTWASSDTIVINAALCAETLVLLSGQKFVCFVVHFYEKFWFWYQTGIVPKKVYAVIWPLLEISSLKLELLSLVQGGS